MKALEAVLREGLVALDSHAQAAVEQQEGLHSGAGGRLLSPEEALFWWVPVAGRPAWCAS